MTQELTASMSNLFAWRLGMIAKEAGDPQRKDVGDPIDRGLILLRLLNEKGFTVTAGANDERLTNDPKPDSENSTS